MQENETANAVETSEAVTNVRPDLDITGYIPDWFQPAWDFFSPYPGLATLLLIAFAYMFGKLLKLVIYRSLMNIASRTSTN